MMRRAKRAAFWGLLVLFVVLSVWWCFHFPYKPEPLLRAIPLNASFVSRHENLGERWDDFVKNPVVQHLSSAFELDKDAVKRLETDGDVKLMVRKYVGRDLVIGYVPSLGGSESPAWVFATWAGAQAQLLRLYADCGLVKEAEPVSLGFGRKGWRIVQENPKEKDMILSVAIVEGMILGCLSTDPAGVRYLVARVEARAPVVPAAREWLKAAGGGELPPERLATAAAGTNAAPKAGAPAPDRSAPDKGWTRMPESSRTAEFLVRSCAADRLRGTVRGDLPVRLVSTGTWATAAARQRDVGQMEDALREAPAAVLLLPPEAVQKWLVGRDTKPSLRALVATVRAAAAEDVPVLVAIGRPEYNGHIMDFGVPSAVAALKLKEPQQAEKLVATCLDLLNAGYGFGLIARKVEIDGQAAIVIQGVNNNGYGRMNASEQLTAAVRGEWLILGSNREAMAKVIAGWKTPVEPGQAGWARDLSSGTAAYSSWFDLDSAGKGATTVLALYDLMAIGGVMQTDPEIRQTLALLKSWIEALKPLKTCSLFLQPDGRRFTMEFGFGKVP